MPRLTDFGTWGISMTLDQRLSRLNTACEMKMKLLIEKQIFQCVTDYRWYYRWGMTWEQYAAAKERARRDYHAFTKHPLQILETVR